MPEWKRKPCVSMRILRQEKEEICVEEGWIDVVNVAAMVCHLFMLQHCPASLKPSHLCLWGSERYGLNMISERWSEAHSWFVLLLHVVLHFSISSPWSQRVDEQHQKSVQERWHNPHGRVMRQTGHMTARRCLARGSSDRRYIIQFLDGETGGKTQKNLKSCLKEQKKPLGPLAAHWTRKKAVHVRVQVASHKRGQSVRWKIFFFLTWGTSDENCQRMSQSMT